jgi:hypothetical protein
MAILGGSPLGLIGVASRPVRATGMSTFNADNSRNINVTITIKVLIISYNRIKHNRWT